MGGNQSADDGYDTPVDFDAVIADALAHGWRLEHQHPSGYYLLQAPQEFICRDWAAIYEKVQYNGTDVFVPSYAHTESVRRTGTRLK